MDVGDSNSKVSLYWWYCHIGGCWCGDVFHWNIGNSWVIFIWYLYHTSSGTLNNELKQQVELNRDFETEDNDLKAIDKLLIEKMLPRRNSIIFFRTGL